LLVDEGPRQARALIVRSELGVNLTNLAFLLILTGITKSQAGFTETPQSEIAWSSAGNTGGSANLIKRAATVPGLEH
jgi:hypothetical protein